MIHKQKTGIYNSKRWVLGNNYLNHLTKILSKKGENCGK